VLRKWRRGGGRDLVGSREGKRARQRGGAVEVMALERGEGRGGWRDACGVCCRDQGKRAGPEERRLSYPSRIDNHHHPGDPQTLDRPIHSAPQTQPAQTPKSDEGPNQTEAEQ